MSSTTSSLLRRAISAASASSSAAADKCSATSIFAASKLRLQLDGPQPCPQNPIRLTANKYPQFIYSPYDENRMYPPDTDCQFLIEASSKLHRIHLIVVESELEEALFTECDDYVSVRDREGNETNSKEVVRWCGQDYPAAVTSSSDSLFVHFHSDSVIQKRGFNISVIEFELPGCPPEWHSDSMTSPYCYKQFVLPHILPWFEAQKECNFERANLAIFQSEKEYAYIVETFSQTHSFPWVGYTDANVEGVFETVVDRSAPLWPENFPLKQESEAKDCVFLDWNKREQQVAYEADDCRNRRPFLCKRKKDGTEVPAVLPSGMIRRGFRDFSIDYTILIIIVVALLFLLVVACVVYQKFKERNNRVANADLNQRMVQPQQQGSAVGGSHIGGSRSLLGGSKTPTTKLTSSAHKGTAAAAPAALATKEREKQFARSSAAQKPPPLESQDSAVSFALQPMEALNSRQWSLKEQKPPECKTQSPRIRLSPNQPEETEEEDGKRGGHGHGQEEGEERRNLGYEPDSDEEREGEGEDDETLIRRQSVADIDTLEREDDFKQGGELNNRRGENEGGERASLAESLGEFRRNGAVRMEVPIRPEITIIREKGVKGRKEEEEDTKETEEGKESWDKEEEEEKERESRKREKEGRKNNIPWREDEEEPNGKGGDETPEGTKVPEEQDQHEETTATQKASTPEGMLATREGTLFSTGQQSTGSHLSTSIRLKARRKSFEKPPPVGPLDNVSAISLDEFWQKDERTNE
uniref:CUB domain-containing protein n=1 Tax=Globodera rostochiensis TaxID=31243 RepID=A0A914GSJ7_GLORO